MAEENPMCPECGYPAGLCWACPTCGHCDEQHGYDGVYCSWRSPAGLFCPCGLNRSQVMAAGIERWNDDNSPEEWW